VKIKKEVKVGLLVTISLSDLYLGSNFMKGKVTFSRNNIYHTIFDSSQGLTSASPVFVKGTVVGKVHNVKLLPEKEYAALVTFETQKRIVLTDTTEAKLVNRTVFGDKAIELLIKEGKPLERRATIPGKIEQGLGEAFMENLLPTLDDAKAVSALANQFLSNLAQNTSKINAIVNNLEKISQNVDRTIAGNKQEISVLAHNLAEISKAFSDEKDGIVPLLTKLNSLTSGVQGGEIKDMASKFTGILQDVEKAIDKTESGDNTLSKILHDDQLYNNVNKTLVSLNELLVDLRTHPWRYIHFSLFGRKRHASKVE